MTVKPPISDHTKCEDSVVACKNPNHKGSFPTRAHDTYLLKLVHCMHAISKLRRVKLRVGAKRSS